jgi:hypothetical protein
MRERGSSEREGVGSGGNNSRKCYRDLAKKKGFSGGISF